MQLLKWKIWVGVLSQAAIVWLTMKSKKIQEDASTAIFCFVLIVKKVSIPLRDAQ